MEKAVLFSDTKWQSGSAVSRSSRFILRKCSLAVRKANQMLGIIREGTQNRTRVIMAL